MALKRSSLAFLLTVVVALIAHGPGFHADAAPIDRLLALIPSSSTFHSNDNQQQFDDSTPPPQPSLGRAQIRPIGQRQPFYPSRLSSTDRSRAASTSRIPSSSSDDSSATVWYQLHQTQQRQQLQQQKMQSILSVRIQQQTQQQQTPTQQQQQQPPQPQLWSDRTLGGHAVLDDDDDDAGNELLDTESDGLLRPDADDEVEGTIEGEVLEEEEDDDEEEVDENETYGLDEDKEDVGSNDDAAAGDIYEPWETTLPPVPSSPSRRLTHREVARRTRLARMREGNEESL